MSPFSSSSSSSGTSSSSEDLSGSENEKRNETNFFIFYEKLRNVLLGTSEVLTAKLFKEEEIEDQTDQIENINGDDKVVVLRFQV